MSVKSVGLIVGLALLAAASSAHATVIAPAVEYTSNGLGSDSRPFTLGYQFSLSAPVTVNALGYWSGGSFSQQVGIWNSSSVLVAYTTVLGTDPVVGHFSWDTIAPVTLSAGTYTIGGTYNGGPVPLYAGGVTTIPQFTWLGDKQLVGSGLNLPTDGPYGFYGQNAFLIANFSVTSTPLPAALPLFATGLGIMGFFGRRGMRNTASL